MEHFALCKLEIFLPEDSLPALREALWSQDAGHIGRADRCLSWSPVTSCWRPLPGSEPYLGTPGELCIQPEVKAEVTCPADRVDAVVAAVRAAHPYEEPVINVIPLYRTGLEESGDKG